MRPDHRFPYDLPITRKWPDWKVIAIVVGIVVLLVSWMLGD